jgi:hypothetical protein
MNYPLAKDNAFGNGSPSCNLPFPSGNITAAEIIAYVPHWLKSIDVIDRLVTNGGRAHIIAAMVNEFGVVSRGGDGIYRPNSVRAMMNYSMNHSVHSN